MSLGTVENDTDYVHVYELHPDINSAACKKCDTVCYGSKSGIERHGFTFCTDHDPLEDSGMNRLPARPLGDDYVVVPFSGYNDAPAYVMGDSE